MILVFGGTTEGRTCVKVLDEAGTPFFYSTKGTEQTVMSHNGIRLTGAMERDAMIEFINEHHIRMIVDAAHPFATHLHSTVAEVADECAITALRYERLFPQLSSNDIVCRDYSDAVMKMKEAGVHRLLALTGVKTIAALKNYWSDSKNVCFMRILNRNESFAIADKEGFPMEHILLYDEQDAIDTLIDNIRPDAIITKESGMSGGFEAKEMAALMAGIPLYVVRRPSLPEGFITVTGPHGLRRAIEKTVPGFFALRTGFTTGSCATAAAKAALLAMKGRISIGEHEIAFTLPDGETMRMITKVSEIGDDYACALAVKDGGDDPDIIHNHEICVRVERAPERKDKIMFVGDKGIGTITLPGIGLPIGAPAINITPRKMITSNLSTIYDGSLNVIISIPDGEQLAKNTFNPKIGIVGGLSIIGTSGIVKPFSAEAFADAVKREMEVAVAMGAERIVLNSGAKSDAYIKGCYPSLPAQAFIHYGNFIGRSLKAASALGVRNVTLGAMIGKAVKLAAGNLDTHSKKVVMDRSFLKRVAIDAHCTDAAIAVIDNINLARELWTALSVDDARKFFHVIAIECHRHCVEAFGSDGITFMLIDEEGEIREKIN